MFWKFELLLFFNSISQNLESSFIIRIYRSLFSPLCRFPLQISFHNFLMTFLPKISLFQKAALIKVLNKFSLRTEMSCAHWALGEKGVSASLGTCDPEECISVRKYVSYFQNSFSRIYRRRKNKAYLYNFFSKEVDTVSYMQGLLCRRRTPPPKIGIYLLKIMYLFLCV